MMWSRNEAPREVVPWNRDRLLMALGGVAAGVLVIVVTIVFAVAGMLGRWITPPSPVATAANGGSSAAPAGREEIASAPMYKVDPADAYGGETATDVVAEIRIPAATVGRGPAGVATGFPHNPEGAVGQLAAIEQTVLESMDLQVARDVHSGWVMPGGPAFDQWELTQDVTTFLSAGQQPGAAKEVTTTVVVTPAAAMVKGTDGPDWAVACVLLDVQASIKVDSRIGYGYCARMQWAGDRWMVAAGAEPARAPSTWPGSKKAAAAGWLTWVSEEGR